MKSSGFSLIELMVVVAIIGILAAIGIPQYAKFQSKTRQSEAKSSLLALFTGEKSFYFQWNNFTVDLKNAGVQFEGRNLRYVTGFQAAACTGYSTASGAPVEATTSANTWSDGGNVNVNGNWTVNISATRTLVATGCNSTLGASSTFVAAAIGDPSSGPTGTPIDGWSIDQEKKITNNVSGL